MHDGADLAAQARSPRLGACGIIGSHADRQDSHAAHTRAQIKALQVQLAQAQETAQLFEAVLEVLKKDYGVRVVKKPLGKSSRKTSSKG